SSCSPAEGGCTADFAAARERRARRSCPFSGVARVRGDAACRRGRGRSPRAYLARRAEFAFPGCAGVAGAAGVDVVDAGAPASDEARSPGGGVAAPAGPGVL